ncbi:MAG: iron uptake protein [Pseudomonadota bacterium]
MPTTHVEGPQHRLQVIARVLTGVVGVWAFTWAFAAFGVAALYALGMDFHQAEGTLYVVGFLLFLCLFLWTFATRHLAAVAVCLLAGTALLTAAAWLIQQSVVA